MCSYLLRFQSSHPQSLSQMCSRLPLQVDLRLSRHQCTHSVPGEKAGWVPESIQHWIIAWFFTTSVSCWNELPQLLYRVAICITGFDSNIDWPLEVFLQKINGVPCWVASAVLWLELGSKSVECQAWKPLFTFIWRYCFLRILAILFFFYIQILIFYIGSSVFNLTFFFRNIPYEYPACWG